MVPAEPRGATPNPTPCPAAERCSRVGGGEEPPSPSLWGKSTSRKHCPPLQLITGQVNLQAYLGSQKGEDP